MPTDGRLSLALAEKILCLEGAQNCSAISVAAFQVPSCVAH